jgi:thioredoxin
MEIFAYDKTSIYICSIIFDKRMMKKKIIIMLSAFLGLTAMGCQGQSQKKESEVKQEKNKSMGTIQLTKADFLKKVHNFETSPNEWNYLGDKPAIIDFYATWCGPCKMVSPILEELSKEYEGKIVIYKVDTDQEEELSAEFGIRSIPSILFIPMKGEPQMMMGAMPKDSFKKAIDSILLKK